MTSPLISVEQLSVNYDKTPVLWDVSLEIPEGSMVGILGPNGAGKSTLIKAMLGLIEPLSGHIEFWGQSLSKVRKKIAYVPQRESVDWDFPITVHELVMMGRSHHIGLFSRPSSADHEVVRASLEKLEMEAYADRQISQLSGGQQQRVFIARALAQEAELYLLDEPFAAVDMATEAQLVSVMHGLQKQGKTLLVVHHDLNTAKKYFDWTVFLNLRLVASGLSEEVLNSHNIETTYGRPVEMLEEMVRLSKSVHEGHSNH